MFSPPFSYANIGVGSLILVVDWLRRVLESNGVADSLEMVQAHGVVGNRLQVTDAYGVCTGLGAL